MRTYQNIILEPIILEDVIAQTNTENTVEDLRDKIQFENDEESLVFGLSVTENNPVEAAELANTTSRIFQSKIGDILPVESVTILSEAIPDSTPVSPNIVQNLLFGAILGFFIGLLQILLTSILDKRVKSDEIIADLGWLNLGSISEMSSKELKETIFPEPHESQPLNRRSRVDSQRLEDGHYVRQTKEKA
jgi:capsular polysaccharide biosynthesis protein